MVRKVINFYTKRKSTVNLGVIDLKKAFDKLNFVEFWACCKKEN